MLLEQTVTIYRRDGTRRVISGCQFLRQNAHAVDIHGQRQRDKFSLIVQGAADLRPGDKVVEGVAPDRPWQELIPERIQGLVTVGYVQPFYWAGRISHTEAGGLYERY